MANPDTKEKRTKRRKKGAGGRPKLPTDRKKVQGSIKVDPAAKRVFDSLPLPKKRQAREFLRLAFGKIAECVSNDAVAADGSLNLCLKP